MFVLVDKEENNSEIIFCFFFNDTATTEIYTLSLHDALPIWWTSETVDEMKWQTGNGAVGEAA